MITNGNTEGFQGNGASNHYLGEAGARYSDAKDSFLTDEFYEHEASYFLPYIKPEDNVLDFGCGSGGILHYIRQRAKSAVGLEINPARAAIAHRRGCTVVGSLSELRGGYDVIISNHVLEHVLDPIGTLRDLRLLLAPTGRLILKLPINDHRERGHAHWVVGDENHHLFTWTPLLLGNMLQEAGFLLGEHRVVTSAPDPRLAPLKKVGLDRLAFWMLSVLRRRRQIFAVATIQPTTKAGERPAAALT